MIFRKSLYAQMNNVVLSSASYCRLIIYYIQTYRVFLLVGMVFVISGCAVIDIHHDPKDINNEYLDSIIGHSMEEVLQQLGEPGSHYQQSNKDYMLYRAHGDVSGIWFLTWWPVGYGDQGPPEIWCFLLEFGPNNQLENYEANHISSRSGKRCSEFHWELLVSPAAILAANKPNKEVGIFDPGGCWHATKIERKDISDPMLKGDYFLGRKPFKIPPGQYVVRFETCHNYRNGRFLLTVVAGHVYELKYEDCIWTCAWSNKASESKVWIEDKTAEKIVTEVRTFYW